MSFDLDLEGRATTQRIRPCGLQWVPPYDSIQNQTCYIHRPTQHWIDIAMKPNRSSDIRELSAIFSLIRPRRQQRAIGFVPSAVGDQSILSQLWWPITWCRPSSARQMSLVYWRLSYTTTPCRPLPLILLRRQIGFILNQEYMWIEKLDTHIFYGVVTDKQWNQRKHP